LIYLDTHVVVWLYGGNREQLSPVAIDLIRNNDLFVSPVVLLELTYLNEIGRIRVAALDLVSDLSNRIGLSICRKNFNDVIVSSLSLTWTRDPFDRMITGHAGLDRTILVTRDQTILSHYSQARW
jgi:PIN domain nuclease of toxin-antitoxin system